MNKNSIKEKIINDNNIREYFLNLSYKKKGYKKVFVENVKDEYKDFKIFYFLILLLPLISLAIGKNIFSLEIINNYKEVVLFTYMLFLGIVFFFYCMVYSCNTAESEHILIPMSGLLVSLFTIMLVYSGNDFLISCSVIVALSPLLINILFLLFVGLLSFEKEDDLNINIKESDHQNLIRYMKKEEMVLFLKEFKKYSDLPFNEMRKESSKIQKEMIVINKDEVVENYVDSLYENQ